MPNVLSFFTFSVLAIFTPGPNNIMSLCIAGKYGFRKCLAFNAGVAAGFLLLLAASVAFSYTLYNALPGIKPVMRTVGAAYMLYLAWKTLRSGKAGHKEIQNITGFGTAILLQFINPKGVLFCITVASGYLTSYEGNTALLAGITLLLVALVFASTCLWSGFGAVFQKLIDRHRSVFNSIMALLLVYCAVSLFL